MLKKDLKTGVVYAWRERKHNESYPVVFVSLDVYRTRRKGSYDSGTKDKYIHAPGEKPQQGTWGYPSYGYLAVEVNQWRVPGEGRTEDAAAEAQALLPSVTLDQVIHGKLPHEMLDGKIITRLATIEGTWDEVHAADEAARAAQKELWNRQETARQRRHERADAVKAALAGYGMHTYFNGSKLEVSLDDAEKLVANLNDTAWLAVRLASSGQQ